MYYRALTLAITTTHMHVPGSIQIRHEKRFKDFAKVPVSLVYSTDYIDDKFNNFNCLFTFGLGKHASHRTKTPK